MATTTETKTFDVFLSHNSRDKPAVMHIAERLRSEQFQPWLDAWFLTPGGDWQQEIYDALGASSACALFVGPNGLGDWARMEIAIATDRAAKDRDFALFSVLLPGVPEPFDPASLPPFLSTRTWIDLRKGLDDARGWRGLVAAIRRLPPGPPEDLDLSADVCPYRGLETFDESQSEFFFGRDATIQRMVEKLKGSRFLAVFGASGSGKSSVVRAGLIPALRRGILPHSQTWPINVLRPGAHPIEQLGTRLLALHADGTMQSTVALLREDNRTLHYSTAHALADKDPEERVVWVIDQFEEVFTLCKDEDERRQFIANLVYAATDPDGRNIVILTLRADFYPRCAAYPELSSLVAAQQILVGPMDAANLRRAIEEPAQLVGLSFEPGLVDTILADVGTEPGALPLLEYALFELWQRRKGHTLTLQDYWDSGRVSGAIATRAEETFNTLSPEGQAIARQVLLRLTQPGEGTEDTRRRATMDELVPRGEAREAVESVVDALVASRLLTSTLDPVTGQQWIDVTHEAVIRSWPRLQAWIDEDRAGLRLHRRLTEVADEWQELGRDPSVLYRGAMLAAALEWRSRNESVLNQLETEFVDASVAEQEREQRATRRRARAIIMGLSGGFVVVAILAVIAALAWQNANRSAATARSEALVAESTAQLAIDPELSILLAVAAWNHSHNAAAIAALRHALAASHIRAVMRGDTGPIVAVAYSPDGRYAATGSRDGTARLWNAATGRPLAVVCREPQDVNNVAFSPDGTRLIASGAAGACLWNVQSERAAGVLGGRGGALATAGVVPSGREAVTVGVNGLVTVWNAGSLRPIRTFRTPAGTGLQTAALSPVSDLLATAAGPVAWIWDLRTGREVGKPLSGHSGPIDAVAWSPDGSLIATASVDMTARTWDARNGRPVAVLRGHTNGVNSVDFSPDGKYVLTGSTDTTARVFDARGGGALAILRGHDDAVVDAVWSPLGRFVVTTSLDHTARIWRVLTQQTVSVLLGHIGPVNSATFSPDGQSVLTGSDDGTARVWDAGLGHIVSTFDVGANVDSVAYSPNGRYLATGDWNDLVRVWDARTGSALISLQGHHDIVNTVRFAADGMRLLSTSDDGTARIWNATIPLWGSNIQPAVITLNPHAGQVKAGAFSPDGRFIALVSDDQSSSTGTLSLWSGEGVELYSQKLPHVLLYGVAFGPHHMLATAGGDNRARIWRVPGGRWAAGIRPRITVLEGHTFAVSDVAFSPDGTELVTASQDHTARIWSVATGKQIAPPLALHSAQVNSAAYSPDARFLVTASDDRTARVWDAGSWDSLLQYVGHRGFVNDATFSPDGHDVATASDDHTVQVYACDVCGSASDLLTLASRRVTRDLTPQERQTFHTD